MTVPVLGLPYMIDRVLYVIALGLFAFGLYLIYNNGYDHYKKKIEKEATKLKDKQEKKARRRTREESTKLVETFITEEEKAEIMKSIKKSADT